MSLLKKVVEKKMISKYIYISNLLAGARVAAH